MQATSQNKSSKTIHIATYNLYFSQNKSKLVQNIRNLAADGVSAFCLQEVVGRMQDEEFILNELINLLGKDWKYVMWQSRKQRLW